jgi:hypothetical protein
MRTIVFLLSVAFLLGPAGLVLADTPGVLNAAGDFIPAKVAGAVMTADVTPAIERTGKIAMVAGLLVTLLTQLMRSSAFGGLMQRLPRRKRILVPIGLSAVSGLLTSWLTGMNWQDATWTAVETAAMSVFAAEGILAGAAGLRGGEALPKAPTTSPDAPTAVGNETPGELSA